MPKCTGIQGLKQILPFIFGIGGDGSDDVKEEFPQRSCEDQPYVFIKKHVVSLAPLDSASRRAQIRLL